MKLLAVMGIGFGKREGGRGKGTHPEGTEASGVPGASLGGRLQKLWRSSEQMLSARGFGCRQLRLGANCGTLLTNVNPTA